MTNSQQNLTHRWAQRVSQWGNPLIYSPFIFYASAAAGGKTVVDAIAFAAVAVIMIDAPVFVLIFIGLQKGRYQHWHVPDRIKRNEIYALASLSTALAFFALYYVRAPIQLLATLLALLLSNLLGTIINRFWKISIHAGGITGAVTVITILYGLRAAWLVLLIPVVAWSRVVLGEHTLAQVTMGVVLTTAITLFAFSLF